jgi:hypothetical protein
MVVLPADVLDFDLVTGSAMEVIAGTTATYSATMLVNKKYLGFIMILKNCLRHGKASANPCDNVKPIR